MFTDIDKENVLEQKDINIIISIFKEDDKKISKLSEFLIEAI